ncbi:AraC family transcriptional regulator [Marinisporobacter balticus]|uniref:AraC family transcriptional regulator n=1 Tax=Marinisporobacter balticus TaxID=2018667 RepID=A0A4V6NPG4_9FIRM|nr:AraC family transcriptional regulator [Marinisporobacter balticus]TCO77920.1 AraC family transcriptional regulator [Marinisporobacter balticus]
MNYYDQLEKAINFIEQNLCEDIKVEAVAGVAGYSYFHFHRIFEAVLGETVGNYIRLRRLTSAAYDIVYTDRRILDIALTYRFDSQEAFSRAFKKLYKVTPREYRKNRIETVIGSKKKMTTMGLKHLMNRVTVQPMIKEVLDIKIIGMRSKATINNNLIPKMWNDFNPRILEIESRTPQLRGYGICEVNPNYNMYEFNEDAEFNEIVGVEVENYDTIPPGMIAKALAGGKYAIFTHRGSVEFLRMTYQYIWGTWIIYSKYEVDLRDDFEFYDERFLGPNHDSSEFDIYIPIK